MKKFMRNLIFYLACCGVLMQAGCYGSFKLVNKVYEWNGSIEDKYVRSLVFVALCIIPVYGLAGGIDALILNAIEFWSGTNPLSMKKGQMEEQTVTIKGRTFRIQATRNQFQVVELKGNTESAPTTLVFTPNDLAWNVRQGNELLKLSQLIRSEDGAFAVRLFSADRIAASVALNEDVVHRILENSGKNSFTATVVR
jgi:hypothetical protein